MSEKINPLGPGKERALSRNLLTAFDETMRAMAEIEGDWWLREKEEKPNMTNIAGVIKFLQDTSSVRARKDGGEIADAEERKEFFRKMYAFQVYGGGGSNRWYVYPNGDVAFSGHHNPDERVRQKARALGFYVT